MLSTVSCENFITGLKWPACGARLGDAPNGACVLVASV